MKRMHTVWLCMALVLNTPVYAQEPPGVSFQHKEPASLLFKDLPDKFECDAAALEKLLTYPLHERFTTSLSQQFLITGTMEEKVQQSPGIVSFNIKVENYHNALFNISVRLLADNSLAIRGRIHHFNYGDVLLLDREKGKYFFEKKPQRLFMPD